MSWSNPSGHRRLPGEAGLDGSASDRELVDEADFIEHGPVGTKAMVLQNVERPNGSVVAADRGSMLPPPLAAANGAHHRQSPGPKDVEAGITVDTSISVFNSSKS